ncbi:MAG: type VI secretion system ATPase TssH, partial [Clostridia bacterium]|nr:type VI secretion system ATPase TssH [Clostridia bacterium]
MDIQKLTQKSLEVIKKAQSIAIEHENQQVEQLHLLDALLKVEDSLILQILKRMNVNENFVSAVDDEVARLPQVKGDRQVNSIYITQDTDSVLTESEKVASKMKDEYVSVEHLMLALFNKANDKINELFKLFNVKKSEFLKVLQEVRGTTRVTSDNPEETYDVLKKYGTDLVELARNNKIDPVIGRDDEIRNVIRILSRKTKNNPCLIGEPGVGKTAIA